MCDYQYSNQDCQIGILVDGDLKFDNRSDFRTLLREFDENDATTLVVDLSKVQKWTLRGRAYCCCARKRPTARMPH